MPHFHPIRKSIFPLLTGVWADLTFGLTFGRFGSGSSLLDPSPLGRGESSTIKPGFGHPIRIAFNTGADLFWGLKKWVQEN